MCTCVNTASALVVRLSEGVCVFVCLTSAAQLQSWDRCQHLYSQVDPLCEKCIHNVLLDAFVCRVCVCKVKIR